MRPLTVAFVASLCLAACGSSSKPSSSTTPKAGAGGPAPTSLVGVYTTKLTKQDVARNRAPELQVAPGWKLTIANTGGAGSGRAFTLSNAKEGELESPDFAISGKRIVLKHEECSAGGSTTFHDNEYRITQSGKTLRFTKVRDSCGDRVAETILTSEPWTKR